VDVKDRLVLGGLSSNPYKKGKLFSFVARELHILSVLQLFLFSAGAQVLNRLELNPTEATVCGVKPLAYIR
jgi:hypothetical protein